MCEGCVARKAPFPWFGGKSSVAADVWCRFGDVKNYVEPFFGSGAVLLSRPHAQHTETINDKDRFIANFWRAVRCAPEDVVKWLDWPVNEVDLTARHMWLLNEGAAILARCDGEPDFYDAKVAGWWCWGACSWIGSGWCSGKGPWSWDTQDHVWLDRRQLPHVGDAGMGINRQLPHVGNAGMGINRKLPHVGDAGACEERTKYLHLLLRELSDRLRGVRVCCGDWSRVCGPSVTTRRGLTGVFLDPPYPDSAERAANLYATDCGRVADAAAAWALSEGGNPKMRIAFCGYEGTTNFPSSWSVLEWKSKGGFGLQGAVDGRGRANASRERIWFSPHCLEK